MIPPICAGCDRPVSQLHGFACHRCAIRLPDRIKADLRSTRENYPATHRLNVEVATEWLRAHPWREPVRPTPEQEAEQKAEVAAALGAMVAVLEGTGEHAEHHREQVGRCVFCSCGARVQGRMTKESA